jgi:hypothetical protein
MFFSLKFDPDMSSAIHCLYGITLSFGVSGRPSSYRYAARVSTDNPKTAHTPYQALSFNKQSVSPTLPYSFQRTCPALSVQRLLASTVRADRQPTTSLSAMSSALRAVSHIFDVAVVALTAAASVRGKLTEAPFSVK